MALNLKVGTLTQPGSPGNVTITLDSGFAPKAIIMWGTNKASEGFASPSFASWGVGFGTYRASSVSQGYMSMNIRDASGFAESAESMNTDALLALIDDLGVPDAEIDLVSMADTEVVVNWATLDTVASILVHYMVIGGSDVTDALVHNFALATAQATQDVTVTSGFGQPDLMFFISWERTTFGDNNNVSAVLGFSVAKSNTERYATIYYDLHGANTMTLAAKNAPLALITGTTPDAEADLSAKASWPTDGFQLSYSNQAAVASNVIGLALKGSFTSKVTSTDTPTSTSSVDTDHGSPPKGALIFGTLGPGTATTWNTTGTMLGQMIIGALDGTNEAAAAAGNDDNIGTSIATHGTYTSRSLIGANPNTSAAILLADGSISENNVRLTYTTVDTSAHRFGIVTLGSGPTAPSPPNYYKKPQVMAQLVR